MTTQHTQFEQAQAVMASALNIASKICDECAEAVEHVCRVLVECHLRLESHDPDDVPIRDLIKANPLGMFAYASCYQSMLSEITTPTSLSKRKAHGAYYTPTPLVDHIVERSVLKSFDEFTGQLAGFRVCDPAVGVGAFLLRSLHLLTDQILTIPFREEGGKAQSDRGPLARARGSLIHQTEPGSSSKQESIDTIIRNCLYGVDIDPIAVMLCRAVLACESSQPRQMYEHLAAHIKVGNAVVGATPELIERGITSDAFVVLDGDDKRAVSYYKKRNTKERRASTLVQPHRDDPDKKLAADAWCAAFVWRMHMTDESGEWDALTQKHLDTIRTQPSKLSAWMRDEINRLAREHSFFHWHLEFPEVICPQS
ncbi:MAG: hypothetical protein COB69_00700 [Phycisphaera sp.]|nr:MAG: hypothetical protein COB69_00700 [Phycisphaera sp.]